jgi:hypothetical protein
MTAAVADLHRVVTYTEDGAERVSAFGMGWTTIRSMPLSRWSVVALRI